MEGISTKQYHAALQKQSIEVLREILGTALDVGEYDFDLSSKLDFFHAIGLEPAKDQKLKLIECIKSDSPRTKVSEYLDAKKGISRESINM